MHRSHSSALESARRKDVVSHIDPQIYLSPQVCPARARAMPPPRASAASPPTRSPWPSTLAARRGRQEMWPGPVVQHGDAAFHRARSAPTSSANLKTASPQRTTRMMTRTIRGMSLSWCVEQIAVVRQRYALASMSQEDESQINRYNWDVSIYILH